MRFSGASLKSSPPSSRSAEDATAIGSANTFITRLKSALRSVEALSTPEISDAARPAGVLVPLFVKNGAWHVMLNVRSEHVGHHKGEVAFPGGTLEPTDEGLATCALREAQEEMGIAPEHVHLLGDLHPVLTRTDYVVQPFVGVIPYPYDFVISEREVAGVLEVPIHWLLDRASERHEGRIENGALIRRLSYAFDEHLIFGATAQILTQFLAVVRSTQDGINREEPA